MLKGAKHGSQNFWPGDNTANLFLYPATLKSVGIMLYPPFKKISFECPSVRPSVSASFSLSTGSIF